MNTIQKKAFKRALELLNAVGAEYKIFMEGTYYGDLKVDGQADMSPGRKRAVENFGKYAAVYKPYIDQLEVGGVAQIPVAEIKSLGVEPEKFRGMCSSYAVRLRGRGSLITALTDQHVECMRIK